MNDNNHQDITNVFSGMSEQGDLADYSVEKYVLLRIASKYYGISTKFVQNILNIFYVEKSRTTTRLAGMFAELNRDIPVIDVHYLINKKKTVIKDESIALVIKYRNCERNHYAAIVADEIYSTASIRNYKFVAIKESTIDEGKSYVNKVIEVDGKYVCVIDSDNLIEQLSAKRNEEKECTCNR